MDCGDCDDEGVEYQHNGLILNSRNVSSSDLHLEDEDDDLDEDDDEDDEDDDIGTE